MPEFKFIFAGKIVGKIFCRLIISNSVQVIKPRSLCVGATAAVSESCPEVAHVFMYRDPATTVASFCAMFHAMIDFDNR